MTTLLAEQPIVVSLMLSATAIALLYSWLQTGKTPPAVIGLILILLIPVAFLVASRWVTDRERIKELIYETADAVEANDHERAIELIAIDRPETIRKVRQELPRYEFDQADVTGIRDITIVDGTYPLEADVDLNANVVVTDKRGRFSKVRVLRRLKLRMQKVESSDEQPDRWVVLDYTHMPITGKPDPYSP